jgi:bifunctional DNase/RNase
MRTDRQPTMIPVTIHSVGLDQTSGQPIVLLREEDGERVMPIWIGQPEATAILMAMEGIEAPRPMTHDLLLSVIESQGLMLERVEITRLEGGTFFAALVLRGEEKTVALDARPSDSMALAVRAGCPILVSEAVFEEAGVCLKTTPRMRSSASATSSITSNPRTSVTRSAGGPLRWSTRRPRSRSYSYRSAVMGSRRDARQAG